MRAAFDRHFAGADTDTVERLTLDGLVLARRCSRTGTSSSQRREIWQTECRLRILQANTVLASGRRESAFTMFESTLEFLRAVRAAREPGLEYSCHIGAAAAADLDTERGKIHWRRHVRAAYHLGRGLESPPPDFGKTAILAAELSFERGRLDAAKEEFSSGFSIIGNLNHKLSREVIPHLSRFGVVCLLLGDYGKAADLFEKVSKQSSEVTSSFAPQDFTSTNGGDSNVWERLTCQSLVYGAAAHGAQGDFDSAEFFLIAARRRGDIALELQSLRPTLERAAHRALLRDDRVAAFRIAKVMRAETSS